VTAGNGFLLDTHALIWWWLADRTLSAAARDVLEARGGTIFVSAVSGIEIAIKVRLGKLPTMTESLTRFDELVAGDSFVHLPVAHHHAIRAGLLEGTHRDPFDRMLAAQALIEDLTVITRDRAFADFGCKVAW
jgi:PIN domain nuclease of toxin-antitoxin system